MTNILHQPIDTVPLTFIDVETTGLDPQDGHRICEIAIVRVVGLTEILRLSTLVNPERELSPEAARINGLSDEDLRNAPTFREIAYAVLTLIEDDGGALVAHNAPFDLAFLMAGFCCAGYWWRPPANVIDTLQLARSCFSFPRNSLPVVAWKLGIPVSTSHRALADVETTRAVFERMLVHQALDPVLTLEDVLRYQTIGRKPPKLEAGT